MNEHSDLAGDERGVASAGPVSQQRWRTILAVLLIVLGCVLAPLGGVAVWARNQLTNTDRYVRTVAPLAADPAIQTAVADQITTQIFTYLDVQGLANQTVDALAARGLRPRVADQLRGFAGPLASGIQGFVRTEVGKIVQSQAFADAWVQANRVAHDALVKTLTGQGDGTVTVEGDTVTLNLAPFIATVNARLVEGGFDLATRIPQVNTSFVLFDVSNLTRARSAFNLLNTLGICPHGRGTQTDASTDSSRVHQGVQARRGRAGPRHRPTDRRDRPGAWDLRLHVGQLGAPGPHRPGRGRGADHRGAGPAAAAGG
jgi:hypothetical protein